MQGYDYFTDGGTGELFAIQRSTGAITEAVTVTVPVGTYFKTPEQQEADRRHNEGLRRKVEREETRRAKSEGLKELGKYFFAVCDDFTGLSDATVARLVYLATFLPIDSGKLYKTERTPLRAEDLPHLMGLSQKSVGRFLEEAKAHIVVEEDGGVFLSSPVFIRGNLPKEQYTAMQRLYRDSIRSLYRTTPLNKHHLLGLIYRLLPYINQEFNVLCHNPEETQIDNIELLSLREFCDLIGKNYAKMYRLRAELKKLVFDVDGKKVLFCNFVSAGADVASTRIFINPRILYNGSNYKNVEILGKFCEL